MSQNDLDAYRNNGGIFAKKIPHEAGKLERTTDSVNQLNGPDKA